MVSSTTKKAITLAISLLAMVISLTGVALGADIPTVAKLSRNAPGFAGEPGKMVRDDAGNFYATDFWGKKIVKLDSQMIKIGSIAINGRPTAVAVLPDSRLVVTISKPTAKVAFYSQTTGEEITATPFGTPASPLFNPTGIAVEPIAGYIYVLDSGDVGADVNLDGQPDTSYFGKVRVYDFNGVYKHVFGARTIIYTSGSSAAAGSFKKPMGIAFEKVSRNIVVADTMNQRLQFFTNYTAVLPCQHVKSVGNPAGDGGGQGSAPVDNNTVVVRFGEPADIAFEYNDAGTLLNRMYVAERGKGAVVVVDPLNNFSMKRINRATGIAELKDFEMNYPNGVVFGKTTNSATSGVLYVSNAANGASPANILALGIDTGTVPTQSVTMTMNPVPATSATSPINVSGTTSPGVGVTCTVNGKARGAYAGAASWTGTGLALDAGMNYILCKSASGNAYKDANTYFGTAGAAPVVAIAQPGAGLYTNSLTVKVEGTTAPGNATVQLINDLGGTTTTMSDASGVWSKDVTLAEGSNLLTVTAWREGTSTSSAATVTVVADFTPPSMTLSFLANNKTTTNAVQNLDGIVVDANLAKVEVNGVEVLAGAKVTLAPATNTYFSTPVILERGANTVTIKATDLAGNSATITRTPVTLNPELPGFTVDLPADNSYRTAAGAVAASGTANAALNSVNAAGTTVTPSAGNWTTAAMSTSLGFNYYEFNASGPAATTVTEKRTINAAAAYAQAAITSPSADIATNTASVTVVGNVPSANPAPQISINGVSIGDVTTYGSGAFSHIVPLIQGLNSVKITTAGTTAVRNIVYDTAPPELVIQADSKPMPTFISGSLEPSAKMTAINATLNLSPVAIPLSKISFEPYDQSGAVKWKADLTGYAYDAISFSAMDPAGNPATLAYKEGIPTGDIDGDGVVRLADALASLRHVAGTAPIDKVLQATEFFNGDVGGLINGRAARDGVIDISDSVLILNKAYGLMNF